MAFDWSKMDGPLMGYDAKLALIELNERLKAVEVERSYKGGAPSVSSVNNAFRKFGALHTPEMKAMG